MPSPRKNKPYTFRFPLVDAATGKFRVDPTIELGDFAVSTDGAALISVAGVVELAGSVVVRVDLSQSQMNGTVFFLARDQDGDEWEDYAWYFDGVEVTEAPDELLNRVDAVEVGATFKDFLQSVGCSAAGLLSGAGSGQETLSGAHGGPVRMVATVDANGNRTAIEYTKDQ